jgi:rod shape-determining protein MreB
VAGDEMTEAVANYIKKKHHILIGEQTAERIKIELGKRSGRRGREDYGSKRQRHNWASKDHNHNKQGDRASFGRCG